MKDEQLALPFVLDRYVVRGSGPNGGSSFRFSRWLEKWRGVEGVRVLVSADYRDVIAIPADLDLEADGQGFYRVPDEVLP